MEANDSKKPEDPLDAGLTAAFGGNDAGPASVLTIIQQKTGDAPHISLREEDSAVGGASPVIDARSAEKLALPQGRGHYQLMGEIARGGMGVVLKGHDADLGRDVALKVLHKDLADKPEILQRFVEEAQIGGQLQHPGIVPVYELGLMADERPYFTMKLVKGRTLATLLAERTEVSDERRHLLDTFVSVCQTIAYAHSRGVIHRDLKPANIMVGAFGEVQVVDWGLAKVLARGGVADEKKAKEARSLHTVLETVRSGGTSAGTGSGSNSMVGSVMGTPAYMPPEQAAGMVDKLDERADVFALGAILCEILTGMPPYAGEAEKTLIQAAQGELDDALRRLDASQANEELVKLTKRCLMPAAATRPRNAGVLAEKLKAHLESVEDRARRLQIQAAEMHVRTEEALVHAQNERKARKLILALAASVVGMITIGGGGFSWVQNERAVRREQALAADRERSEREVEIGTEVSQSLGEASAQIRERRWSEAAAAIERARALANTAESADSTRRWFSAISVREGELEKARAAALFVADLERAEQGADTFMNFARIDDEFAHKFSAFGIDVDESSPEQVSAALAERGVGVEVAPAVDRWIALRRHREREAAAQGRRPEDLARALHLVEVAHAIDDDVLRADLREALINDDVEMLTLMSGEDISQEPSTSALLSAALILAGERDDALRILRAGVLQHPAEYQLRTTLLAHLRQNPLLPEWNRAECFEAILHSQASLALRPENVGHRGSLYMGFLGLAWDAERRGETEEAKTMFLQALVHLDAVPTESSKAALQLWRGLALEGAGYPERALEAFAVLVNEPPAFDHSFGKTPVEWRYFYFLRAGARLLRGGALDDALAAFEPLLASVENGGVRDEWAGEAFGQWALARALLRAREGNEQGAVQLMREAVEESWLHRDQASAWLAFNVALLPRPMLFMACGASTSESRERMRPALEAIQAEALRLIESVGSDIDRFRYGGLRGILLYRNGDPAAALEALEEEPTGRIATRRGDGSKNAYEWYFMAMAHHELGNAETARYYYERAIADTATRPISTRGLHDLFELLVFRDEAEASLGIGERNR